MATIKHNHVNEVGSGYDATSEAPVSGWEKLHPPGDVVDSAPLGQSNSEAGWQQV